MTALVPPPRPTAALAAAPPGAPGERASQVLPSVACSTCKAQVPMLELGSHVCPLPSPSTASAAAPFSSPASSALADAAPSTPVRPTRAPLPTPPAADKAPRPLPRPQAHDPQQQQQQAHAPRSAAQQRRPSDPSAAGAAAAGPADAGGVSPPWLSGSPATGNKLPTARPVNGRAAVPSPTGRSREPFVAHSAAADRPTTTTMTRTGADDEPLQPPPNVFARPGPRRSGSQSSLSSQLSGPSSPSRAHSARTAPTAIPPPPPISHPSASSSPLPSPPLNPWALRPSSPALSTASSGYYNPAPSSFHTPTLSYSFERATKTPEPVSLDGSAGVSEQEAWRIMREAEAGGGAGRAGVGRRAFQLAAAQVMRERQAMGALGGPKVETFRVPTLPSTHSSSTQPPHSPFPIAAFAPALQSASSAPSSASSPAGPASVFSHGASHAASGSSLSSGHQHEAHRRPSAAESRPSFESQLVRKLSSAAPSSRAARIAAAAAEDKDAEEELDAESTGGGAGLGESFIALADLTDSDSDGSADVPGPWRRTASPAVSEGDSLRSGLLRAVQQHGAASSKPAFVNAGGMGTARPDSPPSSSNTHSSHAHDAGAPATATSVRRPLPEIVPDGLMTPSSSTDHLVREDLPQRCLPPAGSAAAKGDKEAAYAPPVPEEEGMEDLESMVDAMRQAMTVSSPSSGSGSHSSLPSPSVSLRDIPALPLPVSSASVGAAAAAAPPSVKRRKTCLRCFREVGGKTGRRFVAVKADGDDLQARGGWLCEQDWKEMYLPRCRRCNEVIESEAVSSSDGQLKGKYHRHCFTCASCAAPFSGPDFYVHADRPHCRTCYHRATDTLCAACAHPIEGPCAVAGGRRFHPACLRCGEDGCGRGMEEYCEVGEGRLLCEEHADEAWATMQAQAKDVTAAAAAAAKSAASLDVVAMDKPRKRRTLIVDLR